LSARTPGSPFEPEIVGADNKSEAEKRFTTSMNRSLGILSRNGLWRTARPEHGELLGLFLTEDPLPIVCAGVPIFLHATLAFEFERDRREEHRGRWKVGIREYIYSLRSDRAPEHEFLAWHWHPTVARKPEPHAHSKSQHPDIPDFDQLHIPTSRIFFEDILLFLHEELGATCSEGGAERLKDLRSRTRRWATWR
jgi:hypothetical protein